MHGQYIDFDIPTHPNLFHLVNPKEFIMRMRLRWIGQLLSRLSEDQMRQACRAAGYSPREVEEFTSVVEKRIKELNQL